MRSAEKGDTRSESPTTFSCSESSPECNFTLVLLTKMKTRHSSLSVQRVLEIKVKQLSASNATVSLCIVLDVAALQFVGRSISVFFNF